MQTNAASSKPTDAVNATTAVADALQLEKIVKQCISSGSAIVSFSAGIAAPALDRETVVLDFSKWQQIIEHEPQDQVISVSSGITVGALNDYLKPYKQWFPVCAPADTSLLELLGTGDGGAFESGYGPMRDLVLGLHVVTGSGDTIKTGGKVVKNVTGYDTTKLFVGSRGMFGVPYSANLRLYARPESGRLFLFTSQDAAGLLSMATKLIGAGISLSCLELFDSQTYRAMLIDKTISPALPDVFNALLVGVQAQENLVKELIAQIESLIEDGVSNLSAACEQSFFDVVQERLSSSSSWQRSSSFLQTSVSISQAQRILESGKGEHWLRKYSLRPIPGRLTIFVDSSQERDNTWARLIDLLSDPASPHPVSVGTALGEYNFNSPAGEAIILKRLKQRFDPSSCLNPLVKI